jgi:hypothetical protein
MPNSEQLNEQKDPVASDSNSTAICSKNSQFASGCFLENQEATSISLIDDWIDA